MIEEDKHNEDGNSVSMREGDGEEDEDCFDEDIGDEGVCINEEG